LKTAHKTSGKIIALTLGDPEGIGPEIVYKSLAAASPTLPLVIIGDIDDYEDKSVPKISHVTEAAEPGIYFYNLPLASIPGDPSFEYVRTAVDWALDKKAAALVTAPISKEKWLRAGVPYKGHTQLLADMAGANQHAMFFWSGDLKVALFTVHIPLKEVFTAVRREKIISFIRFIESELYRLFSKRFNILVSGLNPHAGENGFMGSEEKDEIIPAIEALEPEMNISGPFPPDIIFIKARQIKDSVVVSWYHDQGLIAFKLLNIHCGVNMTLGLPYIRTSPDHGTAYDIAGKGIADPTSMKEAIKLAECLVKGDG
jgi:4-hydroxythreonine-4-phosphate dehydrogenase